VSEGVRDYLKGVASRLDSAGHGGVGGIVHDACEYLGYKSQATLYRQLKRQVGWQSGRKTRADKGTTRQDLDALAKVASFQRESVRKNGKQTMHSPVAISIAKHNGLNISVSPSRVNALMRARKMNTGAQKHANPAVDMRALYPNHVHQVDPSLCLVYYAKGEQHIIEEDEFYKNKLDNFARIEFKCWRYVLTDRASNWTVVRYYAAKGENTKNLFDFLMYAWAKREGRPFHGVPAIMIWDKGSANTSATIKNMLDALDVNHIAHIKGNARAKGSVEQGNNRVECQFECRLKSQPVKSVAELNSYAEDWMIVYNGNLDPHQDTRLRREYIKPVARTDLWLKIKADQLRILPDIEACRATLQGAEVTRKVKNLKIHYKHPRADKSMVYMLDHCDGVCDGDTIHIRPMLFGECIIMARVERYDGEDMHYRVEPVMQYDEYGQRLDAGVFGENFKAHPDTVADTVGKQLDRIAYPDATDVQKARDKKETPHKGLNTLDYISDIEHPTYLPKRGTDLPIAAAPEIKPMSLFKAQTLIAKRLGRPLERHEHADLTANYPDGMSEDQITAWIDAQQQKPALRAVS